MNALVTFGEIMGRINPKGNMRLVQTNEMELTYGGAEANVAIAVANLGMATTYVTKLPNNELGRAAMRCLKSNSVDCSKIIIGSGRLGLYFVEKGASQRPSNVIYDRTNSVFALSGTEDYCWDEIFSGARWFHFTGITPALSKNLAAACMQAVKTAKNMGLTVSCDLNYRSKLWSREKANKIMTALMPYVDVLIANEEDADMVFCIKSESGNVTETSHQTVAAELVNKFNFSLVAITLRDSLSASDNGWSALLYDGKSYYTSNSYNIHLVDRVGGGDAFSGGLIYSIMNDYSLQHAVNFAAALSCLQQTTEYDFSVSTLSEVEHILAHGTLGRIQR